MPENASSRRNVRGRITRFWAVTALFLGAIIVWAALQQVDPLTPYVSSDKVRHILAFGVLGICTSLFGSVRARIVALFAVLCFALGVEIIQIPSPERNASFADLAASLVGAFAGYGAGASARSAYALAYAWIARRRGVAQR